MSQTKAQLICELLENANRLHAQVETIKTNITQSIQDMPCGLYPLDENRALVVFETGKNKPVSSRSAYDFEVDRTRRHDYTPPTHVEKRVRIEHYQQERAPEERP